MAGNYTVDRHVDDLERRYGGIDSVLIWPTHPNMGIDNRNQHDLIRSMPGGVAGVRQMIADFHRRGVRVLFPMMMWDQGTRLPEQSWSDEIANLMAQIGADGINGDAQDGVPLAFSLAADKIGHPLVFEPENGRSDEALAWNLMTWGQYEFPFTPLVDRYKWLEPRHVVNISDRWNRGKDQRSSVCLLQWGGMGKLGKHFGYLQPNYAARCRCHSQGRPHRTRVRPLFRKRGLAANGADTALRRVCQPLAARRTNVVYGREPERI